MLVMVATTVAAGAVAAVPAILGVVGNPSFSQQIPVRVPSQVAHISEVGAQSSQTPSTPTRPPTRRAIRSPEPGDDHGGARSAEHGGGDDGGSSGRGSSGSGGGRTSGSDGGGRGPSRDGPSGGSDG
jgi:hypothetical protein